MDIKYKHDRTKTLLSPRAIKDYKEIYFLENGIHLNNSEAQRLALQLLRLFKFTYRPIPTNDNKEKYAKQ